MERRVSIAPWSVAPNENNDALRRGAQALGFGFDGLLRWRRDVRRFKRAPLSQGTIERLIGTIRREYLDRMLFWTTADLEANRKIREIVQGKFPADGWLSEEDKDTSRRLGLSRIWVIDPIDGTKEFIEGVPQFAVSIGFVVDGRPKVSVVYNPAEDLFYKAEAGQGATLNDQPIRVTPRNDIDGALLLVSRSEPRRKFQVFVDRCKIQPVGSIAFRLAKVGGGDGDGAARRVPARRALAQRHVRRA